MIHTFRATYDGESLHPLGPLPVAPNTELELSFDTPEVRVEKPASFIETALSMKIEGPPDWSERLDHYLYGGMVDGEE